MTWVINNWSSGFFLLEECMWEVQVTNLLLQAYAIPVWDLNEGAKCIKIGKPCPPGTEGCCDKFSCWKRNTRCCCPKPETTANPTTVPTTAEPTLKPTTVLRSGRLRPSSIERFHMTSRRPYWSSKTMKRRPCWCSKPVRWELNSFLM